MIKIKIKKRYWYLHENSDSIFKDTRENYLKGLNTMEGSFVHEIGPVIEGTKEEEEKLLAKYNSKFKKYWYCHGEYDQEGFISDDPALNKTAPVSLIGEALTGDHKEYTELLLKYWDLPF